MTTIKILIAVVLVLTMITSYAIGTEGPVNKPWWCALGLISGLAAALLIGNLLGDPLC